MNGAPRFKTPLVEHSVIRLLHDLGASIQKRLSLRDVSLSFLCLGNFFCKRVHVCDILETFTEGFETLGRDTRLAVAQTVTPSSAQSIRPETAIAVNNTAIPKQRIQQLSFRYLIPHKNANAKYNISVFFVNHFRHMQRILYSKGFFIKANPIEIVTSYLLFPSAQLATRNENSLRGNSPTINYQAQIISSGTQRRLRCFCYSKHNQKRGAVFVSLL